MNKNKTSDKLIDKAYEEAIKALHSCAHSVGIKASAKAGGYPHIWARDAMITLLGASLVKDAKIINSLKASFNILKKNQTPLGCIPNNVHIQTLKPNFQAYADTGVWFVAGAAFFFKQTGDKAFLKRIYPAIEKIMTWYEYQDVDQTGLITMAEAADWEDLFAVRGKGLYVNILHYLALREAGFLAKKLGKAGESGKFLKKARKKRIDINKRFWYKGGNNAFSHMNSSFGTEALDLPFSKKILKKEAYYLPYSTFRDFGEWFDSFGNLLAILSGVADKKQSEVILSFIKKYKLAKPYPIKAIYPPITPGEKDWRDYYKSSNLNLPHQYHNGGIWPFLGGFYVAVLVKMKKYNEAREALLLLARANKDGKESPWEFNEWLHAKTGKPAGMSKQAWSAGMYIYAYESVRRKKTPFF